MYKRQVEYFDFFELDDEGLLFESDYTGGHDQNFNAFNIDLVYTWEFSPASELSIVWKNAILNSSGVVSDAFFSNFSETIQSPQTNSISLKLLYYLDYSMVKGWKRKNSKK